MKISLSFIKENIEQFGNSEACQILKEWVNSSNDQKLRQEALDLYGYLENGQDFKFLEQIFLSDENPDLRLISGNILKEHYLDNEQLISLLEFTLRQIDNIDLNIFSNLGISLFLNPVTLVKDFPIISFLV